MATLENRLILLGTSNLAVIGEINYYHRYTIYTKDNGEQWILRSGPSGELSEEADPKSEIIKDIYGNGSNDYSYINFTYEKYKNSDGSTPYYILFGQTIYPADRVFDPATNSYDNRLHLKTGPFVQGTVAGAIINFAIAVVADHRMDSDEYGEAVAKALTSATANDNFPTIQRSKIKREARV